MNTMHTEGLPSSRVRLAAWRAEGGEVSPVDVAIPIDRVFSDGVVARPGRPSGQLLPPSRQRLGDPAAFAELAPGVLAHRGTPVVVAPVHLPVRPNIYRDAWVGYQKLLELNGARLHVGPRGELSALGPDVPWPNLEGAFVLPPTEPVHHLPPPFPVVAVIGRSDQGPGAVRPDPGPLRPPTPLAVGILEEVLSFPFFALDLAVASVDPASLGAARFIASSAALGHVRARTLRGLFHPGNPQQPMPEALEPLVICADRREPFTALAHLMTGARR